MTPCMVKSRLCERVTEAGVQCYVPPCDATRRFFSFLSLLFTLLSTKKCGLWIEPVGSEQVLYVVVRRVLR